MANKLEKLYIVMYRDPINVDEYFYEYFITYETAIAFAKEHEGTIFKRLQGFAKWPPPSLSNKRKRRVPNGL